MKVSLITTVLNEENSIKRFLASVMKQTKLPEELVIVDGGSTDRTVESIKYYVLSIKRIKTRLITKKGNRSVGRNTAIKNSNFEVIAVSDAGCILDKNWLKNIILPFNDSKVAVVSGYYKGIAKNVFQKCLIPYVLVMEDEVEPNKFLPASRSMAFKKAIWEKVGGFPEKYSHNEDYVFSNMLKKARVKIVFAKNAIVYWLPRDSLSGSFVMFFRFAYGDAEAQIIRSKVLLLFARYFLGLCVIFIAVFYQSSMVLFIVIFLFLFYLLWSILKNYKYVNHPMAFFYLPLLQITSDIAVILGTSYGLLKRFVIK